MSDFVPYERLADEGSQAWASFVVYRDMGPARSLAKAARELGKSKATLEAFSVNHDWVARAASWDAELDRIRREELREAQRKMVREHARVASIVRAKATEAMEGTCFLDPDQAIKWLMAAVKIEQTSIGLPTERTAVTLESTKDADAIYFDALSRDKLLALGRQAIDALQAQSTQATGGSHGNANAVEDEHRHRSQPKNREPAG